MNNQTEKSVSRKMTQPTGALVLFCLTLIDLAEMLQMLASQWNRLTLLSQAAAVNRADVC